MIRVGIAQINTTVGDLNGNAEKIIKAMASAQGRGVDVIVFPEMTVCGYPPEDLLHKNHFVQNNKKILSSLKKQAKGIIAIIGFVDTDKQGKLYNAAAVLSDGKVAGIYRKEHLPNYGVFDEKRYFSSGKDNPIFRIGDVRIGVNICEDIWSEDGVHTKQAKQGIDVLINMACSPYDIGKLEVRRKLLAKRAKETKVFIVYANLVGGQDEIVFDGGSCIFDPKGRNIVSALLFQEDFLIADIKIAENKKRKIENEICLSLPLNQRRFAIESKKNIEPSKQERIYKALVLGTHDYIRKNGFDRVVIGLSGGIDSALVAKIAVDALGKDKVIAVTMPSQYTSDGTRFDAERLAENLGIEFLEVPIKPIYDVYIQSLKEGFEGKPEDVAEENIQARIRGNILMGLSNKHGWIVLTTGNKSEMAVGYCTLYGDMSGGFAVIKDVYKTTVYELARLCNEREGCGVIPQSIIDRAPSAELREGQTDQDSLPEYEVLDDILIEYVEKHSSFQKINKKIKDEEVVKKILWLVDKSEYKRRQSPPGIKITSRAFGKDWRLPITNKYKHY